VLHWEHDVGFPTSDSHMTAKLTLDRAGRVLIPKTLRQKLHLGPGDALHLDSEGEKITLRPMRPKALLKKERGVWVYQGGRHATIHTGRGRSRTREAPAGIDGMKEFFDTSVLVGAFWRGHPNHEASLRLVSAGQQEEVSVRRAYAR